MQVACTFATPSVYEHSEGRSSLLLDDLMPRLSKLLRKSNVVLAPPNLVAQVARNRHSRFVFSVKFPLFWYLVCGV